MKGVDIFCASQASTAICLTTDHASSSSSSNNTIQFGGRAIDRHNPIIADPRRTPSRDLTHAPSSSSSPKPSHDLQKPKKNTTPPKPSDKKKKKKNVAIKGHGHDHDQKKKSTAEKVTEHVANNYSSKPIESILRRSWVRPPSDLIITPPTSSRYLLGDTISLDAVSDNYEPVLALTKKVDSNKKKAKAVHEDGENNHSSKRSSSSVPKSGSSDQVSYLSFSLRGSHVTHMNDTLALSQDSPI